MMLTCLAFLTTLPVFHDLVANTMSEVEGVQDGALIIAPEGIHIPADHHGLAFMDGVPDVAIKMFDPEAEVMLSTLSEVSQTHVLLDVTVAPSGGLRGLTLQIDGFPHMPGENPVKYVLLRPDGTVEFVPARADEPGCRVILQTDSITGGVSVRCQVTDCTGMCNLIGAVQPDGSIKLSCGCVDMPPDED